MRPVAESRTNAPRIHHRINPGLADQWGHAAPWPHSTLMIRVLMIRVLTAPTPSMRLAQVPKT